MKWKILSPLSLLLFIHSSSIAESTELKKASFIPQWAPQAQSAAFYVAHKKGPYRKNGIDLALLQGRHAHFRFVSSSGIR